MASEVAYLQSLVPIMNNKIENVNFKNSDELSPSNFELLGKMGQGTYGTTFQVRKKNGRDKGTVYAMTILNKERILRTTSSKMNIVAERNTLLRMRDHPFVIQMYYAFQTEAKLYFVFEYLCGGTLTDLLKVTKNNQKHLSEKSARYYFKEIVLAVEFLHSRNTIHRDLKPDNILVDIHGHLKLYNFALARENMSKRDQTYTFAGSLNYTAPEVLNRSGHGQTADYWSLGVILYEMITENLTFPLTNWHLICDKISKRQYAMPNYCSMSCIDLISALLTTNKYTRLGSNGIREIKEHGFFGSSKFVWRNAYLCLEDPPLKRRHFDSFEKVCKLSSKCPTEFFPDTHTISVDENNFFAGFNYTCPKLKPDTVVDFKLPSTIRDDRWSALIEQCYSSKSC